MLLFDTTITKPLSSTTSEIFFTIRTMIETRRTVALNEARINLSSNEYSYSVPPVDVMSNESIDASRNY